MKPNRLIILCFLLAIGLAGSNAYAGTVVLSDWCFNVNGNISVCNGDSSGSVPAGTFDTTLAPSLNTLGFAKFTLGPGDGQYVLAYMDYDLGLGAFLNSGSSHGSLPGGYSFELDDPNSSIFPDFSGNALTNLNNVGTASGPPTPCCDVAWALGIGGINVPTGQTGTVIFTVSDTPPVSGFYLQQTSISDPIYLSGSVNVTGGGGPTVPEPETMALLGIGLLAVFGAWKFRT